MVYSVFNASFNVQVYGFVLHPIFLLCAKHTRALCPAHLMCSR